MTIYLSQVRWTQIVHMKHLLRRMTNQRQIPKRRTNQSKVTVFIISLLPKSMAINVIIYFIQNNLIISLGRCDEDGKKSAKVADTEGN